MLYPPLIEQKLGFDQIRCLLRDKCLSSLGRLHVDGIQFSTDPAIIEFNLGVTGEFRRIIQDRLTFPSQDYFDLIPLLTHLRIQGTYPEPEQLSELRLSLITIRDIHSFFARHRPDFPLLSSLYGDPESPGETQGALFSEYITAVDRILNEKSLVKDSASEDLARIRKQMKSKLAGVERKILQTLKIARQSGWAPEEADITVRNGRLVIPIHSSHKRKIAGFIHDESATGQTVFLEPAELFETNNEIRELELAERREIIRILTAFADHIRPGLDILTGEYLLLGKLDFIRSKSLFAIETGGNLPSSLFPVETFSEKDSGKPVKSAETTVDLSSIDTGDTSSKSYISWRNAIHPLLFLSHKKQGKQVVPLNIEFSARQRVLVISGPNAGGKSVCLKTVGLIQYMIQCGMLPPLREDSSCCIFDKIFLEIGDEQSIDNDLSTYTSKLINLKYFLEHIDRRSLFLIDEFGSGTDPSLGGAIAEAALEHLCRQEATGLVTTHYSNLKLMEGKIPGVVNGAMIYDTRKLKPQYKLKIGKPGSSFAFEIAKEIGFPEMVLENARGKTGYSQLNFDRQIQDLEEEKQEISRKATQLRVADEFLEELMTRYQKKTADLEKNRKDILEKARQEALQLVSESNRMIEKTIRGIRESQAEKEKTKSLRTKLKEFEEKIKTQGNSAAGEQEDKPQDYLATRLTNHPVGQSPGQPDIPSSGNRQILSELNRKLVEFKMTLDLRGKRADEAFGSLQRFIDDAIMLSIPEIRILHGKGNGVLRQVTRDYARGIKEIKSVKDEILERGGSGITVIQFR